MKKKFWTMTVLWAAFNSGLLATDLKPELDETVWIPQIAHQLRAKVARKLTDHQFRLATDVFLECYPGVDPASAPSIDKHLLDITVCLMQEPELLGDIKNFASQIEEICMGHIENIHDSFMREGEVADWRQLLNMGIWGKLYRLCESSLFLREVSDSWRDNNAKERTIKKQKKHFTRELIKEYITSVSPFNEELSKLLLDSHQRQVLMLVGLLGGHADRLQAAGRLDALEWHEDAVDVYYEPTELFLAQTASPHYCERVLRGLRIALQHGDLPRTERGLMNIHGVFEKRLKTKDNYDHIFDHYFPDFLKIMSEFQRQHPGRLQEVEPRKMAVCVMRAPLKRSKELKGFLAGYCSAMLVKQQMAKKVQ